jgi:hypothetical protein
MQVEGTFPQLYSHMLQRALNPSKRRAAPVLNTPPRPRLAKIPGPKLPAGLPHPKLANFKGKQAKPFTSEDGGSMPGPLKMRPRRIATVPSTFAGRRTASRNRYGA